MNLRNETCSLLILSLAALFPNAGYSQQPARPGASSAPSGPSAPGGVAIGGDNVGSPITINPDPFNRSCRHPSHGVERFQRTLQVSRTSREMGGGYNQPAWCRDVVGSLAGEYPGGSFSVAGSSESSRNHCPPFNCPQYTYTCVVQVQADPVYAEKISQACR